MLLIIACRFIKMDVISNKADVFPNNSLSVLSRH